MVGKWHLGYCRPEFLPTRFVLINRHLKGQYNRKTVLSSHKGLTFKMTRHFQLVSDKGHLCEESTKRKRKKGVFYRYIYIMFYVHEMFVVSGEDSLVSWAPTTGLMTTTRTTLWAVPPLDL